MSDGAAGEEGAPPAASHAEGLERGSDRAPEARGAAWTPDVLGRIRADRDRRLVALVVAAIVGVAAAWIHWVGLFVAGALVGLPSRDLPRAVAAGFGVGVLVLAVQVLATPVGTGTFLGLAPPAYVAVGAALVGPVWGSLVRGVL